MKSELFSVSDEKLPHEGIGCFVWQFLYFKYTIGISYSIFKEGRENAFFKTYSCCFSFL